jgi:predicted nucleic acid-binding protein
MNAYPDTSFLFSLYLRDSNTPPALTLAKSLKPVFVVSPLHELELNNAIELAVFRKAITAAQALAARKDFDQDVAHWTLHPLPIDIFARAANLARHHTARYGTRSLYILHVATALAIGAEALLTFDRRQRRLAKAEGLRVLPR